MEQQGHAKPYLPSESLINIFPSPFLVLPICLINILSYLLGISESCSHSRNLTMSFFLFRLGHISKLENNFFGPLPGLGSKNGCHFFTNQGLPQLLFFRLARCYIYFCRHRHTTTAQLMQQIDLSLPVEKSFELSCLPTMNKNS